MKRIRLSKRAKFVLSTSILTFALLIAFLLGPDFEQRSIVIVAFLSLFLTLFSLSDDLSGKKWMFVILLPVLFTITSGLFYFLLPSRWLTRIIMLFIFAIGFYAILLVENIYIVSSVRSIKLLHAARTIGFLLSVVCAFGLYSILYSLHAPFLYVGVAIFVISVLLIIPIIWSVSLKDTLEKNELFHVLVLALVLSEIGMFITFWPVSTTFASIFLAGNFYTLVGVSQHWLENRLFKRVLWEFLWVAVILVVVLFFTTKWG